MSLNRRGFLQFTGITAGSLFLSSCTRGYQELANFLGNAEPFQIDAVNTETLRDFAVLRRLSYGPRIEDLQFVQKFGIYAWIEEQLAPELITDFKCDLSLRSFETLSLDAATLRDISDKLFDDVDEKSVPDELRQATIIRQVYSKKQLFESMVEFWTDHFNISVDKGNCWYLKTVDDRDVIRRYAMGDFYDLLQASAHSPAMLIYLDNQSNKKGKPNENYARELMELHTLGVDGGYSQKDVMEVARCLTGWTVKGHYWNGQFTFRKADHDPGRKKFLGKEINPSGEVEAEKVIEILAHHKSTARFISEKLVRRFITENPAPELSELGRKIFLQTKGDIKQVLRAVLFNGMDYFTPKFKRPNRFIISALRILSAQTDGGASILYFLRQMGQEYFSWPTPDGFPDATETWQANLIPRWQFALALLDNKIKGTTIDINKLIAPVSSNCSRELADYLHILLIGRKPDLSEIETFLKSMRYVIDDESELPKLIVLGLMISPEFQRY